MNDLQRYLVEEFVEEYQEGHLSRRELFHRVTMILGSAVLATSVLATYGCGSESKQESSSKSTSPKAPSSPTQQVPPDDPDIKAADVQIPAQGFTLLSYSAVPRQGTPAPGVLVIHENRGLTEHIKDVTRRAAKAGYSALAPDLVSRQGGTAKFSEAEIPGILGQAPPEQHVADLSTGLDWLKQQTEVQKDRLGVVGFCFGGGLSWRMATQRPDLRAAVPFYGPNPPLEDVPKIKAACLGIYGELDSRINQGIPALEAALKAAGIVYEIKIYPSAGHAFHNDTGRNYNAEAAKDAWAKTLAWFQRFLREKAIR